MIGLLFQAMSYNLYQNFASFLNRDISLRKRLMESAAKWRRDHPTFLNRGGKPRITKPQMKLATALGLLDNMEHIVLTKGAKGIVPSLPSWYPVDIAHPQSKIAIEVDGNSHRTKKWKFIDARKEKVLSFLGWLVLRFWNKDVLEKTEEITNTIRGFITSRLKETTTT